MRAEHFAKKAYQYDQDSEWNGDQIRRCTIEHRILATKDHQAALKNALGWITWFEKNDNRDRVLEARIRASMSFHKLGMVSDSLIYAAAAETLAKKMAISNKKCSPGHVLL